MAVNTNACNYIVAFPAERERTHPVGANDGERTHIEISMMIIMKFTTSNINDDHNEVYYVMRYSYAFSS